MRIATRALVALLVVTSCHSIDRGVFAQGPVPLEVLPLREPITFTVGPNAGQVVPTQHGLLASYFSGAAYVQPAYGEALDHQQVDPNIDFQWDASGGVNPVIPVGGIDISEGHPFRPPQWPIWSIVWEGYLEAPTAGDHVLNLHVNNGGWLEMKGAAGALVTVISCPGGSGFEGDCPANVPLTAGRHYIRISYYNNAPFSANAIFSWQRPGETTLSVVPTEALWTQVSARPPVIFVPGFGGSQIVASADRTRTITTSDGSTRQISYRNGELIWLDEGRAAQTVVDPEYFGILRFGDDGTVPAPNDFGTNGEMVRLPGAYDEVEQTLRDAGYVRDRTYFIFTYDFRFGAESWVARLDDLVVRAAAANPGASGVDIIAHSMGTLVTRSYLTSGSNAAKVHSAVLIGGPLLGAPKGSLAATGGTCMADVLFICLLREQTVQYIIRSLPGGLQLGVSSDYYTVFRGQDRDHPVAYLDRTISAGPGRTRTDYGLLREAELAAGAAPAGIEQAERYHADDLRWLAPRSSNVSLIAGTGFCTIGQVVAYSKPTYRYRLTPQPLPPFVRLVRELAGYVTAYDLTEVDGDSTVVRQSASLSDPAAGLAADGSASVYYRALSHSALAGRSHLESTVLPILRGELLARGSAVQPKCTQVSSHSPVELLVTDGAGRRTGATSATDRGYDEILGAERDRYMDMRNITLNGSGLYTVTVYGKDDGDATVKVRWLDGASVARMAVFGHVPTTSRSRSTFTVDDGSRTVSALTLDLQGDGTTILTFTPVMLDGAAAEDVVAPDLTLTAPAEGRSVVGWFPLSWTVVDAGSGPGTSGVAVDMQAAGPTIEEPRMIQLAPGPHVLDAFAEDRAGNLSALQRNITALAYDWLPPLSDPGGEVLNAGRTVPVRFVVRGPDGTPLVDDTVIVDLTDVSGRAMTPPMRFGRSPDAVSEHAGSYHANVRTDGLAPGDYIVRARFSSPRLAGELRLPIVLR